jgi:hypothetical protein
LTSQIAYLKQQHRKEVQALRDALEQAHGENLDLRREIARRGSTIVFPASSRQTLLSTSQRSKERPEQHKHFQIHIEPAITSGVKHLYFRTRPAPRPPKNPDD